MRRAQEAEELARKEKLLKAKEKQLKQKEVDLILREPLAEEVGFSTSWIVNNRSRITSTK